MTHLPRSSRGISPRTSGRRLAGPRRGRCGPRRGLRGVRGGSRRIEDAPARGRRRAARQNSLRGSAGDLCPLPGVTHRPERPPTAASGRLGREAEGCPTTHPKARGAHQHPPASPDIPIDTRAPRTRSAFRRVSWLAAASAQWHGPGSCTRFVRAGSAHSDYGAAPPLSQPEPSRPRRQDRRQPFWCPRSLHTRPQEMRETFPPTSLRVSALAHMQSTRGMRIQHRPIVPGTLWSGPRHDI